VPLADDQPRKDSNCLLQAPDSNGSFRLVLTGPWSRFGRLTSYYIEPPWHGCFQPLVSVTLQVS
jgi:hypothetical protein